MANNEEESDEVILEYLNSWPKEVFVDVLHIIIKNENILSSKINLLDISSHNYAERSDELLKQIMI